MIARSNLVITRGSAFSDIEENLGQRAAYMKSVRGFEILGYSVSFPSYYSLKDLPVRIYHGTDKAEIVKRAIVDLQNFTYVETQSDPYNITHVGANCQAISLVLAETLNRNGVITEYVLTEGIDHMYVRATIGDEEFDIDLVNKSVVLRGE